MALLRLEHLERMKQRWIQMRENFGADQQNDLSERGFTILEGWQEDIVTKSEFNYIDNNNRTPSIYGIKRFLAVLQQVRVSNWAKKQFRKIIDAKVPKLIRNDPLQL